ncbi:MAG: hypothetical protein AMJ43_02620 [Coxiella sp. DG_40]|nr:MAG: hypothetical protein AMJ43_02620 [Coxiella sp. DG_40]
MLILIALKCFAFSNITNYTNTFIPLYTKTGNLRIAIRYFTNNQKNYFLVVNPRTFKTEVVKTGILYARDPKTNFEENPGYFKWKQIKETPYVKDLLKFTKWQGNIQDAGITHSLYSKTGYFLTVDMCPSNRPFEKDFYHKLVSIAKLERKPFPVAICISGLWIMGHAQEFNYLLDAEKNHKLNITWVNHTLSHLYFSDLAFEKNFVLFKFTDVKNEIFGVEKLLLAHNLIPSVFIRFPGLVANRNLLLQIQKLGLIPLGTDAWLAMGQVPKNGSIILVHGNSNEHPGIEKIIPILNDHQIKWLPLKEAVAS